jgi:hypothetical protein
LPAGHDLNGDGFAGATALPEQGLGAPDCVRFAFSSPERTQGRILAADSEGAPLYDQRLSDFVAAIPCFTPYSALTTETGPCIAGNLRAGQRVATRDNGLQEVRWVGKRRFGWRALGLIPALRPVRIAAGALGDGLPERDMVVSPNHRFLASLPGMKVTDATERLWQARALIGRDGVSQGAPRAVEYVQILLDRHELVLAEGSWSESFQPTAPALAALDPVARADLMALIPGLEGAEATFAPVRPEGADMPAELTS